MPPQVQITWFDWLVLLITILGIPWAMIFWNRIILWWNMKIPARQLLGPICQQAEPCKIFVRDLILEPGSRVLAVEPRIGVGAVPNLTNLYPEVEGRGIAYIYNVIGQVGKTQNVELIGLGTDTTGQWDAQLIMLGAQTQKHFEFYRLMENVAYRMDRQHIYNAQTGAIIERDPGYGYGIILKVKNPFRTGEAKEKPVGFLMGGFGTLGTIAAVRYFKDHFLELGKQFGSDEFGIVVRAPVSAGEEAIERLTRYDTRFKPKPKNLRERFGVAKKKKNSREQTAKGITVLETQVSSEAQGMSMRQPIRPTGIAVADDSITESPRDYYFVQPVSTSGSSPVAVTRFPRTVKPTDKSSKGFWWTIGGTLVASLTGSIWYILRRNKK